MRTQESVAFEDVALKRADQPAIRSVGIRRRRTGRPLRRPACPRRSGAHHYRAIIESSDDAILSKDLDGVILSWNRGAERLFGFTSEEAVGKPVTIIIPARPSGRGARNPRENSPRRTDRALRNRASAQGREPRRHFADHLADPGLTRENCRRLENRARHHRVEKSARTTTLAAERNESPGQQPVRPFRQHRGLERALGEIPA